MVDVESNSENVQLEPTSALGRAFIRKNLSSQVLFWVLSLGLIAKGLVRLYYIIFQPIDYHDISAVRFGQVYRQIYYISVGLVILNLRLNRSCYIQYLDTYQTIVYVGSASKVFTRKQNRIDQFFLIPAIIYEVINTLLGHFLYSSKLGFSLIFFLNLILVLIGQCGYVFFLQFIIECCVYTQSSFKSIDDFLDSLLNLEVHSSRHNMKRITKSIRVHHYKAVESIRNMDKYLTFAILTFYLYFIGHCILLTGQIIEVSHHSIIRTLWTIYIFSGEFAYLVLVTYHLVRVNQYSVQIFDKFYKLLCFDGINDFYSSETMNEINLFILRPDRNDVGFTFAGLCMVSPSFVSSMATISLTLGLALPNIISH